MNRPTSIQIASLAFTCSLLALSGCMVGPKYVQPTPPPPPAAYKETPSNWAQASPQDQLPKGNWWGIYSDQYLNSLEDKIAVSNQTLKVSYQQYMSARDLVRQARSQLFPTVGVQPSGSRVQLSNNRPNFFPTTASQYSDTVLSGDVSYEVDLWGQVRRTVEAARENSQASAGDLENVSLSLHAELAFDYFTLRGLDLQKQLLDATVIDFEKALQLTEARFHGGVASDVDVAQAQTQLETTRAQDIETGVERAQFEHAIAVLIGQTPSTFSVPLAPLDSTPPQIPLGVPSELLERRPDIAASERRVAAANAQIGIAIAAYYPQIALSASGGVESTAIGTLLQGPSTLWSVGGSAFQTVFDGGRRRAVTQQARDNHAAVVASYRENVLEAFQQVEDNLAALRLLEQELATQQRAVTAARRSVDLSTTRYKRGITTYLEVLTAQSIALTDERTAADLMTRRMTASVQLIKALGGGWDRAQLPKM
ncbi:efflux transporter outer membrane subunit [Granulicella sp. dw_53]|uniref:efflux transporter outer membrane subunit n=1 Tax=Granulicella sp. dw_53 TaxID=2719792 RepID=UPI001BD2245E|nr:efflux transporter outer membrane subunit [Granulicella sp. dw_53]